jgi:hypothetical protein
MSVRVGERINIWKRFTGGFLPDWLMERTEVSPGAKVTYARLSQFAGKEGRAFPKMRTLAAAIGCKERQAKRYCSELKKHRLLDMEDHRSECLPNSFWFLRHEWMGPEDEWLNPEEFRYAPPPGPSGQKGPEPQVASDPSLGTFLTLQEETQAGDSEKGISSPGGLISPPLASQQDQEIPRDVGKTPTRPKPVRAVPSVDSVKVAMEEAKERTRATVAKNADKKLSRLRTVEVKRANLSGKTRSSDKVKQIKRCEESFLEALRGKWPTITFGAWSVKEFALCETLIGRYSPELVEQSLVYMVDQWDSIRDRVLRGRAGFPSLALLNGISSSIFPEAQRFNEVVEIKREYDAWYDEHPEDMAGPPVELRAKYERVKKELAALGAA